jgi:hypothetical protein
MQNRSRLVALPVLMLLLAALSVGGCGEEGKDPVGIDPPVVLADSVAFSFYTLEDLGAPRLRWVGDTTGPYAGSPEQTSVPWVGFGVPFEIRWVALSDSGRVDGYRWKATESVEGPWEPAPEGGIPRWSSGTTLRFNNDRDPATLAGVDCPGGDECPTLRRWGSSFNFPFRFQLEAHDLSDRVQHFEFGFHVNYPPEAEFLIDDRPDGIGPPDYPRYWYFDDQGDWVATHFADGDTIPAGAYAVFAVEAEDRFAVAASSDSFCCDLPFTSGAEEIARQWKAEGRTISDFGNLIEVKPFWSPAADVDTLGFFVGPFDWEIQARGRDEHGRPDSTPAEFDFVAGFVPLLTAMQPDDGEVLYLRQSGSWPQSTMTVERINGQIRYWDTILQRWSTDPGTGEASSGTLFEIPLRFESEADPRQRGVPTAAGGSGFGSAPLSWGYRWQSEFDPDNEILDGPHDLGVGRYVRGGGDGVYAPPERVQIFVPDLIWTNFEFFDPEGDCTVPAFCDQAEFLRRQLGAIEVELQCKTTASGSTYAYYIDTLRPEDDARVVERDLSDSGRRSAIRTAHLILRLGLEEQGNPDPVLWPPPAGAGP